MSARYELPVVPDELPLDDVALRLHRDWFDLSRDDLLADMPEPQFFDVGESKVGMVVLTPKGDYDESKLVVTSLAANQGWKPTMYFENEWAQELAAPDRRMAILYHNTPGQFAYDVTDPEQIDQINRGNVRPITGQQARAVTQLGATEIALFGYSLGGMMTAALIDDLTEEALITSATLVDVVNGVERTPKELKQDFLPGGMRAAANAQKRAVADTHLPVWSDELSGVRQLRDLIGFVRASRLPINRHLQEGMTHDTIADSLIWSMTFTPSTRINIMNFDGGRIARTNDMAYLAETLGSQYMNVGHTVLSRYGHEGGGSNAMVYALAMRAGIESTRLKR